MSAGVSYFARIDDEFDDGRGRGGRNRRDGLGGHWGLARPSMNAKTRL